METIRFYNHRHYGDPTAFEALKNIEAEAKKGKFKPLVYICSAFSGDRERGVERACGYSRFAVSQNCIPLAPHLLFPQFMDEDDPEQRRLGLFFGLVLQSKCKEMWVFGSKITEGMAIEIEKAAQRGLPVRYFTDRCVEVEQV